VRDLIEHLPPRSLRGEDPIHLGPDERPSGVDFSDVVCKGMDQTEYCGTCNRQRVVTS